MTELKIAIADLARFCHRRGDIDHRFKSSPTGAEGIAGHQHLYRHRPETYLSEYAVEHRHDLPDMTVVLRGRADGFDPAVNLLEEIKTCRVQPEDIPEEIATLHMAQAKLYAALVAQQEALESVTVRVTWLNIDTHAEWDMTEQCSRDVLSTFLADTLEAFAEWLQLLQAQRRQRDDSLADLAFPYGEFRTGQRQVAELAYKCIDQAGELVIEAPTGIGKTAALLFPALKALATQKHDKLIYTTAKGVGRRAAEDTLAHFAEAGFEGRALTMTAKDKICLSPGSACHPEDCPYAVGYYDKLHAAMRAAMVKPALQRENLQAIGESLTICPYELSLDLLPWVDIVIGDIHYVYSLNATVASAVAERQTRWSVLVDEAHNLPERARSMYSATLSKSALLAARKVASARIKKALNRVNQSLLALQKSDWQETDFHSDSALPQKLLGDLEQFTSSVAEALADDAPFLQRRPDLMAFYFDVLQFQRVAERFDDDYRFEMLRSEGKQSLVIRLNCLDPSRLLREKQSEAHAVITFSATLSPLHWSREKLGLEATAVTLRAASPFSERQLKVALATDIDTRYARREETAPTLAATIANWLAEESGNCLVYFPSYAYMEQILVQPALSLLSASRTVWTQQRGGGHDAEQTLLSLLDSKRNVAAFCILGGIFGEGVDLPGDQLTSVIIVGVGTPALNRDTRALQDWNEHQYGNGFDYTFVYPGMQKVDQALGRVVRTLDDKGSALLIDTRYSEARYRALLPQWWAYEEQERV